MANQKISRFLPKELQEKYEIVSNSNGQPLKSSGSIFKTGSYRQIEVKTLTEKKIEALIKRKHPAFVRKSKA